MNKYQKHIASSHGHKLVCVDAKFSKSFLVADALYNFFNSMIKESKYCSDLMKKHFTKELVMTVKMLQILRNLRNVGFKVMVMLH